MSSAVPGVLPYFMNMVTGVLPQNALVWLGKDQPRFTPGSPSVPVLRILEVIGTSTPAEIGPNFRREEEFNIMCDLSVYAGNVDFPTRLSELYTYWALITVAQSNDPTMGGKLRYSECINYNFEPNTSSAGGSIGELAFDVRCETRITSLT